MFSNTNDGYKKMDPAAQKQLLEEYEKPVYQKPEEERTGPRVLEVQCGDAAREGPFTVQKLTEAYLDQATELCFRCVGENLYPKSYIASILHDPDHYFNLLLSPDGDIVGYIYFHLTGLEDAAREMKVPLEVLSTISGAKRPVVAQFQSIGVSPAYRRMGLAWRLQEMALEEARRAGADAAVCMAWVVNGRAPMGDNLVDAGFRYLTDSHMAWYDREDLVCPVCRGRCRCDAAIYYKTLEKRD